MPPKPKFTKDEIALAALDIVKKDGVSALTARELGKRLGSSSCPVFTVFKNMEEVKGAARELGLREFEEYASDFTGYTPAFKRIGMLMVSYAINEPELFKLLFMQEHTESRCFENTIQDLGSLADTCIQLIQNDYEISLNDAETLFEQMWIHAFGLCSLCVMKVCDFSEEEISKRLSQVFAGLITIIKSGNLENVYGLPEKNSSGVNPVHFPFISK